MVGTSEAGKPAFPRAPGAAAHDQGSMGAAADVAIKQERGPMPPPVLPTSARRTPHKGARVQRGNTCVACRKAKTTCGSAYPCKRCFDKGLPCYMPARYHKSRPKGDPELAAREAAELAYPVLIELAFERFESKGVAETMAAAFVQLMAEGVIIRPAVIMGLAFWKLRSIVCGVDVTCGATALMAKHADPPITPLELEGPAFALDMPNSAIRPMLVADVDRLRASIDEFRVSDTFRRLDDDPEHKAIFASVFDAQGRLLEAGNALFEEAFLSSHEFLEESLANRVVNTILFSALIAPEDRILWFRAAFIICFTPAQRMVEFVKICDRDGEINLWIMEVCKATLPPPHHNTIIGGIITRLQPAPSSRHLSARPALHHRVQVFRSHPTPAPATASSTALGALGNFRRAQQHMQRAKAGTAAAVAEAKKPTLPAIATLPVMDVVPPADAATGAASAAAAPLDDGARALFGPPNLSKAAAPPLLPCVTGSGHGPMGPGARSPTTDSDCSSPVVVGAAKPPAGRRHRGARQAAAAAADDDDEEDEFWGEVEALPDELWLQDAPLPPLPLLGAGAGEGQQAQPLPAAKAPFEVGSAEEAAMWHDVLQFYLGEGEEGMAAGAGGGAGVGAVGAAGAWAGEEEPGFGWER